MNKSTTAFIYSPLLESQVVEWCDQQLPEDSWVVECPCRKCSVTHWEDLLCTEMSFSTPHVKLLFNIAWAGKMRLYDTSTQFFDQLEGELQQLERENQQLLSSSE